MPPRPSPRPASSSVTPAEKEGLAPINGTDGMLGHASARDRRPEKRALPSTADVAAAMSARGAARHRRRLRRRPARAVPPRSDRPPRRPTSLAAGRQPDRRQPPRVEDTRVQDAYPLRCAPAVAGGVRDTVDHAALVAERELAAAVDNPAHHAGRPRRVQRQSSTARRSPTCWTSSRSSRPTSPASRSAAATASSTPPAATDCCRSRRSARRRLGLHDRPVHAGGAGLGAEAASRCRPWST